jgi:hypothetical protein
MNPYIEMNEGMAEILAALPEQFEHPATAAAALAAAFVVHCQQWGIDDDTAQTLITAALADYTLTKH